MKPNQILCGDARELAKQLPDNSISCIVTSPPYWNLRDYQTAAWDGGDADCDHKQATARNDGGRVNTDGFHGSARADSDKGAMNYRNTCGKCGATRIDKQIGLEDSVDAYVDELVSLFRELRRALREDGTLWLNLGSSYAGSGGAGGDYGEGGLKEGQPRYEGTGKITGYKRKDMIPIPWLVAIALQQDGYYLRSDIIWHKKAPMPASVQDRPTPAHEYLFLLSKSAKYFFDAEAIKEQSVDPQGSARRYESSFFVGPKHETGGYSPNGAKHTPGMKTFAGTRNKRSVWTLGPEPYAGAHFAVMPTKLVEPCILAGTSARGVCGACGAPHERVVERSVTLEQGRKNLGYGQSTDAGGFTTNGHGGSTLHHNVTKQTTGWRPTCTCETGEPVPATVLDPFIGSGTVAAVSIALGRNYLGFELNPDYVELCRRRIEKTQPALLAI